MILELGLFIVMYILLLTLPNYRHLIALVTAIIFIALPTIDVYDAFMAVNWNVILMLLGTMAVVELFIESGMPKKMAEGLLKLVPNVMWAVVVLSLFAGIISAFVDNVATVLMVAPVGIEISRKINTNPIPVIISIAVSSNLQGAATLVGDTTSILLGSYANLSFNDFFFFKGCLGIFWTVEFGALATIPVILYLFRKEKNKVESNSNTIVKDYVPSILMLSVIVGLIIASQFPNKPALTNGYICVSLAIIGTLYEYIRTKDKAVLKNVLGAIDFETLLLLISLFIVIEGITQAGVINAIANLFMKVGGSSKFVMYTIIVFASVLISAFVDNIPYVATMLPVVTSLSAMMGIEPYLFDFGLLIGATLGGNITPVGASANIAGIGILRKEGYEPTSKEFFRIGIPFTMVAVISGYILNWLIWS